MKKVLKTVLIVVGVLLLVFGTIIVFAIKNQEFRIALEEGFYTASDSPYNLAYLSSDLIYTNQYDRKIKYLKIAFKDDQTLDIIVDDIGFSEFSSSILYVSNREELIDLFQCEYLEAYIMKANYDVFKSELTRLEDSFKTKKVFLNYFLAKILQNKFTKDQLHELSLIFSDKLDKDLISNDFTKVFIDYKILASIALLNNDKDSYDQFEKNALDAITKIN